uniref:Uncharacterized protein n=1 Tax=Glossina brevipalpis TaxID=37001 RepID=A0A1A9WGA2_9MUSC
MQFLATSLFVVTVFGSALLVSAGYGHLSHASLSKHDFKGYEKDHSGHHMEALGHDDHHDHHHDSYSHPKYKFDYGVQDPKSGDDKKHWEERDGDKVKGSYSFKEADGTTRVVEYSADKHNGFQAVVKHIGHPTEEKVEHHDLKSHHSNDHHHHYHHSHHGYKY